MKLHSVGVLFLVIVAGTLALSGSPERNLPAADRERFVGAWRLASLEEEGSDGKVHQQSCTGMLIFTADGKMSVQVMYQNPGQDTAAQPVQYAQGGYEASFGKYEIDDPATFTYHVEGALVRTLVGHSLRRAYEFSGSRLVVRSTDPKEHWRVVWQRD